MVTKLLPAVLSLMKKQANATTTAIIMYIISIETPLSLIVLLVQSQIKQREKRFKAFRQEGTLARDRR